MWGRLVTGGSSMGTLRLAGSGDHITETILPGTHLLSVAYLIL